ncbi:class I SAM-dependent methyltransferase [Kitasatospora viridis]|uniref:Ubiquinone/menaquinone biosynthesis C-methylase UbiE n=1 Tax=Kitasatospora viridis TaxID=281105 RepID=A0A561UGE3_9ACTN|nr:methyltransferase domain-containing protein [Kitasatospora viridis]TWF98429.1 ubiquinone/menaquinone biosynthesis C-methylase UbiE [Kitasatospora viridis]
MTDTQLSGESSPAADDHDAADGGFFNPIGARLARLAGLRPGDRVLDLGCGRGAVLFAALAEVGPGGSVVGVDAAPGTVRATGARAAGRGLRNVRVELGEAPALGFPAGSFDAVLSSFVLALAPDPAAALASVHRVLVPGGRFGCTAFGADAPGWERPGAALDAFLSPHALRLRHSGAGRHNALGRSPQEAAELLHAAGFTGVRCEEHQAVSHYPDAAAWWRAMSLPPAEDRGKGAAGGWRAALDAVPAARLDEARQAALAELAGLAAPDGSLVRRTTIRYITASRV